MARTHGATANNSGFEAGRAKASAIIATRFTMRDEDGDGQVVTIRRQVATPGDAE